MKSLDLFFEITDDSGFMAIADPDAYQSYIGKDWDFNCLSARFVEEMSGERLVIWGTGMGFVWRVRIVALPVAVDVFREFRQLVQVSNGRLVLTNYEDLSMAAQYEDEAIPAKHHADLVIPLGNGRYECLVRQLYDPASDEVYEEGVVHFEIVLSADTELVSAPVEGIPWWE